MKLKSTSLATRLLLASSVSAAIIVGAVVFFIKLLVIPQMTENALENQTSALAHSLRGIRSSEAMWSDEELAKPETLDAFTQQGKMVASLFVYKEGKFHRVSTTLKRDDGSRAVGTVLDPESDAAKALQAGREYLGHIVVLNRKFMTNYLPVALPNGLRGAVVVAIDYASADPMLLLSRRMDFMVLGVGAAALVLLGLGLFFSVRVEQRHREIEDIFRTTQEGIFLIDQELRIGSQTSEALSKLLGFAVQPGSNFLEMIRKSVTPKTFDTAKEYFDLLLRHDVKEKLVASLNPLDCVEISYAGPGGAVETRYLQIRFNRVAKGGKITHLLGTASNITRQVRLERELKESEQRVQNQMVMMVHILQAEPRALEDFLSSASEELNRINEEIRTGNAASGISDAQIEAFYRAAHKLKGDASALQLEAIAQSLHDLETLLGGLREQSVRKGEALLPLTVRMKDLFSGLSSIQDVLSQISQIRGVLTVEAPRPPHDGGAAAQQPLVRQWLAFSAQVAERYGKKVELVYQGLDMEQLGERVYESLNSIVNQFIRNSLVHGIERPADRMLRGKGETGRLSVYVSDLGDGMIELSFRDDGAGINVEKIRAAAIRNGRYTPESAARLDARELTKLIFEPGFSTVDQATNDAGRGVGLDAVKDIINQQGGRIRIGSTSGEYCHFRVQLPFIKAEHKASSAKVAEAGMMAEGAV